MKVELITTEDGSHTLFNKTLNETYHSTHGSIQESNHVFIQNGLTHYIKNNPTTKNITILEVGLGTGLNSILAWQYLAKNNLPLKINYVALEPYPIDTAIVSQLNYSTILSLSDLEQNIFELIHSCDFENNIELSTNFYFEKKKETLQKTVFPNSFDIVFYDAFGPRAQPDMWEKFLFEKLYSNLASNGVFVTYCAKGELKRNLKSIGFEVESLQGPPGKREMVRATKKSN
ncbi:MAG: tRNA (5-methylaminomethyl-2-thiouridine)(34)-methyltransferase MnmD [Bacteroidetes bacterium]|nr:tRNA (5-methylaminomethyl-2-thiouridine)(34)-methyltransferase MnmD [Bacteroidota bacterium]